MTRLQIKNWLIFWLLNYSSDLCISLNNFQQELFGSGEFSIQDKVSTYLCCLVCIFSSTVFLKCVLSCSVILNYLVCVLHGYMLYLERYSNFKTSIIIYRRLN